MFAVAQRHQARRNPVRQGTFPGHLLQGSSSSSASATRRLTRAFCSRNCFELLGGSGIHTAIRPPPVVIPSPAPQLGSNRQSSCSAQLSPAEEVAVHNRIHPGDSVESVHRTVISYEEGRSARCRTRQKDPDCRHGSRHPGDLHHLGGLLLLARQRRARGACPAIRPMPGNARPLGHHRDTPDGQQSRCEAF